MNILKKLTLKYLKQNKKRTIVTIIGIILSGAMISAVATLAVSFQQFMLKVEIANSGNWEAMYESVEQDKVKYLEDNVKFSEVMKMLQIGMAQNPYSDEHFLYIKAYDEKALENMALTVERGRLPQNNKEICISASFFDGNDNEPKIGDTITLSMGNRISSDGYELISAPEEEGETFNVTGQKTYTICGIISRPDFEKSSDPFNGGVTLLDSSDISENSKWDVAVNVKRVHSIYEDSEEIAENLGLYPDTNAEENVYPITYNTSVLLYKGVNGTNGFNEMLYSVCGILILIIMVGSIMVIYNSFAISVQERKKQFGMLSSVGATKKQIQKSVLYEGFVLGCIGIPIGILAGIGGIGITIRIVGELLKSIISQGNWTLELVISWPAIVIAIILMALTIYFSVRLPAKRASKITPIEAIRQTDDIKEVNRKKIQTPKWIRKVFGIEGELALKNLKRSRKRYRTTVISLIISIVLYVSVSGFVGYLFTGFNSMYISPEYDYIIPYSLYSDADTVEKEQIQNFEQEIKQTEGIEKISYLYKYITTATIPKEKIDPRLQEEFSNDANFFSATKNEDGSYQISINIIGLNQEEWSQYQKEIGAEDIKEEEFILPNYRNFLTILNMETDLTTYQEGESILTNNFADGHEEQMKIGKVTEKMPWAISDMQTNLVLITTQENLLRMVQTEEVLSRQIYVKMEEEALENRVIEEKVEEAKANYSDIDISVVNLAEDAIANRNLSTIFNIFLYGFIVLISLIGIANIFNTISTNINLRRREFANLKSIGMTDKSFRRMLNLECFFYGTKALLYGVPIGVFLCFLINQGFGNMIEFIFTLPWQSILISTIAVYTVVFVTMLYASSKVKKENIIDVLRNDNI